MQGVTLSNGSVFEHSLDDVINVLLKDAQQDDLDGRSERRQPFFRPATVLLENDGRRLFAFTRDLSKEGIGLLHAAEIEPTAEVTVEIARRRNKAVRLKVRIEWCCRCADDWYLSGGKILSAAPIA